MSRFERILWRDLLPRSPVFTTAEAASVAEVPTSTKLLEHASQQPTVGAAQGSQRRVPLTNVAQANQNET